MSLPRLAITMGDPAGIGPELCLKLLSHTSLLKKCRLIFIADMAHLKRLDNLNRLRRVRQKNYEVLDLNILGPQRISMGKISAISGRASGAYIDCAVNLARLGLVDGLVTMPINKKSFLLGGWGRKYRGHTEMLADLSGASHAALMLASGPLRAVHVTSHIALKDVSNQLSISKIRTTIELAHQGLRAFGIKKPRIGVSALNPQGGEDGMMGLEERTIISPAIKSALRSGKDVSGPYPADVLWSLVNFQKLDVGVAMYHDQGQIPVKFQAARLSASGAVSPGGVNVTLGLPFVRTSPAHGTAYDIAGSGRANENSVLEAIEIALQIIRTKQRGQ